MTTPSTTATHLVFVRHGQSLYNRDGEQAGSDSGLTELGWRQSQAVADWLARRYDADALVSSHLTRARQTAEIIGGRLALPLEVLDGIEEAEFFYWAELPVKLPAPLAAWDTGWQPDPETSPLYTSFRARLADSLAHLLDRHAGQTVIIVSHGGAIGTILRSLFGGHRMTVFTDNTGVTQLTWDEGYWRIAFHNSTAHLAELMPPPRTAAGDGERNNRTTAWANGRQFEAMLEHYRKVARALSTDASQIVKNQQHELVRLAAVQPDDRVLDAATGTGAVALAFAPHVATVLGVDVSPAMLERAETARGARGISNIHFRLGEISSLPLEERSFEIITCHDLLQYVSNLEALFLRFRPLLASSGRLVIDEIIGSDNPVKRATQNAIELRRDPAIAAIHSASDIERALTSTGFRIVKAERYPVVRELYEWLAQSGADEVTRSAVRSMLEAGLEADSAGLDARRSREGQLIFTHTRLRLLATMQDQRT